MKKAYILVVIPFRGKCDLVVQCIHSIINSYINGFTYQFFLIDDDSPQGEIDVLRNGLGNFMNLVYLRRNEQNLGLTQSTYNLVEELKRKQEHTHMLLLNSDVIFAHRNTFTSLVHRSLSNPNIAAVGCKVLAWDKDMIIHTGTRINKECDNWIENPYCGMHPDEPIANVVERRLWVNGCCSMYNLNVLRKENMNFDLDFRPAYFEESDIMTRFNVKGYSVLYEPKAVIRHMMNATNNTEIQKYGPAFSRNWELYLKKWKRYFDSRMLYFQ